MLKQNMLVNSTRVISNPSNLQTVYYSFNASVPSSLMIAFVKHVPTFFTALLTVIMLIYFDACIDIKYVWSNIFMNQL